MSTMTLYIRVLPSDAVRNDGRYGLLPITVELDTLAPVLRNLLAELAREEHALCSDAPYVSDPRHGVRSVLSLPQASEAALVTALEQISAERTRQRAEQTAKQAAEQAAIGKDRSLAIAHLLATGSDAICEVDSDSIRVHTPQPIATRYNVTKVPRAAAIEPLIAQWQAECEAAKAREQAHKDAEAAEQRRQREKLRSWALDHGSERLRLMISTNTGDWQQVAEEEYVDAHAPNYGGVRFNREVWNESGKDYERERPTAEELRALKALQAMAAAEGSILSAPTLRWCVVAAREDEDGEEVPEERFCVLRVGLDAPSGSTHFVAIRFPLAE